MLYLDKGCLLYVTVFVISQNMFVYVHFPLCCVCIHVCIYVEAKGKPWTSFFMSHLPCLGDQEHTNQARLASQEALRIHLPPRLQQQDYRGTPQWFLSGVLGIEFKSPSQFGKQFTDWANKNKMLLIHLSSSYSVYTKVSSQKSHVLEAWSPAVALLIGTVQTWGLNSHPQHHP